MCEDIFSFFGLNCSFLFWVVFNSQTRQFVVSHLYDVNITLANVLGMVVVSVTMVIISKLFVAHLVFDFTWQSFLTRFSYRFVLSFLFCSAHRFTYICLTSCRSIFNFCFFICFFICVNFFLSSFFDFVFYYYFTLIFHIFFRCFSNFRRFSINPLVIIRILILDKLIR